MNRPGGNLNNGNINIGNSVNIGSGNLGNNTNWNHGCWNGGGYGWHGGWGYEHPWGAWAATTAAVGLTSWAVGSMFYGSGYGSYSNPYYAPAQTVVVQSPAIDYSQPIASYDTPPGGAAADPQQATTDQTPLNPAEEAFDAARDAFSKADYPQALTQVETALSKLPQDSTLHEFRALVLFALGRYKDAAGGLYAVLSSVPGWDWTAMSSFYPSTDVYTEQLRKLETFVNQNPKAPEGHFLLGYHYMTAGHTDSALSQFKQVAAIEPNDQVASGMVRLLSSTGDQAAGDDAPPAAEEQAAPAINPPATVVGDWKAAPGGGGDIQLSMKDDGTFTWKYAKGKQVNEFTGKYEISMDMLVMENSKGQTMIARVSDAGTDKFKFVLQGGPPDDPGLTFAKRAG